MTVDQMLWHVNSGMELALGRIHVEPRKYPVPAFLLKLLVLHLPWTKGAPTLPAFVARQNYDFEHEKARCLTLIDELASRDLNGQWATNPLFGKVTGDDVTRLHAKHLDHHLSQFGA
jgi:hypothetical protein